MISQFGENNHKINELALSASSRFSTKVSDLEAKLTHERSTVKRLIDIEKALSSELEQKAHEVEQLRKNQALELQRLEQLLRTMMVKQEIS